MALHTCPLMIIETGTAQALVIQLEPQRLDQMQAVTGVGTQPDDVAGIGRNLGLIEHDIEHEQTRGRRRKQGAGRRCSPGHDNAKRAPKGPPSYRNA